MQANVLLMLNFLEKSYQVKKLYEYKIQAYNYIFIISIVRLTIFATINYFNTEQALRRETLK